MGRPKGISPERSERITVSLPPAVAKDLADESADRGTTVSAVVREAVAEYFARRRSTRLPGFVGMAEHPDPTLSERVEELIEEDFGEG